MIKIANAQLWVHDQDEALAFYTEKLGMEVRSDVTLAEIGDFRWLTVGPPGQDDVAIVLMAIPGAAGDGRRDRRQVARPDGARASPAPSSSTTDDCQASYEELQGARRRVHRGAGGAARTASTPASATRPATASGSPRSGSPPRSEPEPGQR